MTPKWQKARLLPTYHRDEWVSHLIWTKINSMHEMVGYKPDRPTDPIQPGRGVYANIIDDHKALFTIPAGTFELLADFADDVPLVPWRTFLEQCRAAKENPS